jgi:2-dehydro-3-deoxygluconokinase
MAVLFPERPIGIDRAPRLRLDIAGTEANTAIGLARQGLRARFLSRVGDDPFGRRIRATLEGEGVDTRFLSTDERAPTGVFFREPLADGARRVYYYRAGSAASRLGPEHMVPEAFDDARVVHLSGITPALSESCARAVSRAIQLAREVGALVTFDPNYRRPLWDPATARAALTPVMTLVDVLLLSSEDAAVLFDSQKPREIVREAAALGPRTVVLKRAERGAVAFADGQTIEVPAVRATRVIDTVGAGDGFNAGFLAGLLAGRDLRDSLRQGAQAGARAVEKLGDYAGYPRVRTPTSARKGKRRK